MINFETKRHIEIDENYQSINLTEFAIKVDIQVDNDQIVDAFIRSNQFSYDSLRDCVKVEPNKGYLKQAFSIDNVKISDFKKTTKQGVTKFLLDFLNDNDWGDDRKDFAKLLDRYSEIHNIFEESDFFIISKDWFNKHDEKVIEPENWVYTYYFLIILVDRNSNLLTLSEWKYD